ncbi:MAG: c-type cytochrome [Hyphomicrobiales bacterium]|nr:c-type cytochrome [Hyphomicrobiales bacterium]
MIGSRGGIRAEVRSFDSDSRRLRHGGQVRDTHTGHPLHPLSRRSSRTGVARARVRLHRKDAHPNASQRDAWGNAGRGPARHDGTRQLAAFVSVTMRRPRISCSAFGKHVGNSRCREFGGRGRRRRERADPASDDLAVRAFFALHPGDVCDHGFHVFGIVRDHEVDATLIPGPVRGKRLYEAKCAVCHGSDGQGAKAADGSWLFPPLWCDSSFNTGAGMAETFTAASFIRSNMPVAGGAIFPLGQGGLSDQDAVDIADYFAHQPRPVFAAKADGGC